MNTRERLKEWIKGLDENQKDNILLELTEYSIDSEYVRFWKDSKNPYYDANGERLDGMDQSEEDYIF